MINNTKIQSLLDWLIKLQNEIDQIVKKGTIEPDIDKLNNFYKDHIEAIKNNISQRKSALALYKHIINSEDNFDDKKILINNEWFDYLKIMYQLFIPLLSLSTRIYEHCMELIYFLYNPKNPKYFYRLSEVLSEDFYKTFEDNAIYDGKINILRSKYGHHFSIILFFRNQFLHGGRDLKKQNFFVSNNRKNTDILNLEIIKKSYNSQYKEKSDMFYFLKKYFDLLQKRTEKRAEKNIEPYIEERAEKNY